MPLVRQKGIIQAAIIESAHPFDVPGWHQLFRSYAFLDYYPQPLENWLADWGKCRNDYDVALFYNMNMEKAESPLAQQMEEALEEFSQKGKGICILHHALIAFPENPLYASATGLTNRSLDYFVDQRLQVEIANPKHPICQGLDPFEIVDETYVMEDARSEQGNEILFTTNYPKSMHTLGWARQLNNSRVFCLQCGHDNQVWSVPGFKELLGRGLRWLAGAL